MTPTHHETVASLNEFMESPHNLATNMKQSLREHPAPITI